MSDYPVIDHEARAVGRLAGQFAHSPNLKAYLVGVMSEANALEKVFQDILELRSIDTATGKQLDILGELVGQPREFLESSDQIFFGFSGHPQAGAFGDARFKSKGESLSGLRLLTDEEYRVFIRARTFKNSTTSTVQEVTQQIRTILDAPTAQLIRGPGPAEYTVIIGKVLTINEKLIITATDLIPKTAGVTASYEDLAGPI